MKDTEILSGIITKNGTKYQMGVAIEECAELIKELTKFLRDKGSVMHLCEEIADVEVCLAELKLMIPKAQTQISLFKRFKLKRLEKLYLEGVEK